MGEHVHPHPNFAKGMRPHASKKWEVPVPYPKNVKNNSESHPLHGLIRYGLLFHLVLRSKSLSFGQFVKPKSSSTKDFKVQKT